jgi:hypothetical protein
MNLALLGQILPDSDFGKLLTELAKRSRTIVEIGSWHGEGSTRCLVNGLVHRAQTLWTIEADEKCAKEVCNRYRGNPQVICVNAKALDYRPFMPIKIDLLLLDGADETTDAEFDALHERCKIIALDDTNERKNKRQVKLLRELGWREIAHQPDQRNGWAVFERP